MAAFAIQKGIVGSLESYRKSCIVRLNGDLDLSTRRHTRVLLQPLAQCRYGILDLRNARIGDATFFGDLAAAYKIQAGGGGTTVVVVSSNERLRRLFCMVRFDKMFPIAATIAEAHQISALQRAAAQ